MLRLIFFKIVSVLIGVSLFFNCESFAYARSLQTIREEYPIEAANISDWLRNQRIVQQKNDLEALAQHHHSDQRRTGAQVFSQAQNLTLPAIDSDPAAIHQWFTQNGNQSPLGLFVSYPDNAALDQQAFTYDQAVAGIVLLKEGDAQAAKKIFDFYSGQWDGTGLWTVYNAQAVGGSKVEYLKIMGPNAWIGIFSFHYYHETGDPKALELATKIGHWIQSLPHAQGGVAMGVNDFAGHPNWGAIFSVENNLDYYALATVLSAEAAGSSDRTVFQSEKNNLEDWFKTQAYNPTTRLFQRGMSDSFQSLDTNSWAILVFGAQGLKDKFGIDVDALVARSETVFSVQSDGRFGGDPLSAKGFDFSDSVNASSIGRSGVNWVEGTNHMVSVYTMLNQYYSQGSNADPSRAAYYQNRKDYFTAKSSENTVSKNGALGYLYADPSDEQVFYDNPSWKASTGQSAASTAWAYLALEGINPFETTPKPTPGDFPGFEVSVSTGSGEFNNLYISVDQNKKAVMSWNHRSFQGDFDESNQCIRLSNIQDPGSDYLETWQLNFDKISGPSGDSFMAQSFETEAVYSDSSLYTHLYQFSGNGLIQSEIFDQSLPTGTSSRNASYGYIQSNGQNLIHHVDAATTFDGSYGYGNHFTYDYDASGSLNSIMITQETRNDPLTRILETYQLIFELDGSTRLVYFDKQIHPIS